MVEKTELPHPTKNRAINIPGYEWVTAQHIWQMKYRIPAATKTGYRPLISENGARTIGAIAKPAQNVVMPTRIATSLTFHSADICAVGGEYDPAVYAVIVVAIHESHIVKFFLLSDHSKGDVNFLRSGCGGAAVPEALAENLVEGWGSGVSNVRQWWMIGED